RSHHVAARQRQLDSHLGAQRPGMVDILTTGGPQPSCARIAAGGCAVFEPPPDEALEPMTKAAPWAAEKTPSSQEGASRRLQAHRSVGSASTSDSVRARRGVLAFTSAKLEMGGG